MCVLGVTAHPFHVKGRNSCRVRKIAKIDVRENQGKLVGGVKLRSSNISSLYRSINFSREFDRGNLVKCNLEYVTYYIFCILLKSQPSAWAFSGGLFFILIYRKCSIMEFFEMEWEGSQIPVT